MARRRPPGSPPRGMRRHGALHLSRQREQHVDLVIDAADKHVLGVHMQPDLPTIVLDSEHRSERKPTTDVPDNLTASHIYPPHALYEQPHRPSTMSRSHPVQNSTGSLIAAGREIGSGRAVGDFSRVRTGVGQGGCRLDRRSAVTSACSIWIAQANDPTLYGRSPRRSSSITTARSTPSCLAASPTVRHVARPATT